MEAVLLLERATTSRKGHKLQGTPAAWLTIILPWRRVELKPFSIFNFKRIQEGCYSHNHITCQLLCKLVAQWYRLLLWLMTQNYSIIVFAFHNFLIPIAHD